MSSVYEDATSLERATKQEIRTLANPYINKIDVLLVTRMSLRLFTILKKNFGNFGWEFSFGKNGTCRLPFA